MTRPVSGTRRRPETVFKLDLLPLRDVTRAEDAGPGVWVASGDDPQCLLHSESMRFDAGWFRLVGDLLELDGRLEAPCLYPDYGHGVSEDTRIDLGPLLGAGRFDIVVRFESAPVSLRFDPSVEPVRFRFGDLRAYEVSAREAYWLLLRASLAPDLATLPARAKSIADAAARSANEGGPDRASLQLRDLARSAAGRGQTAYRIWCVRADRMLAGIVEVPPADTTAPLLSLLVEASPAVDPTACFRTLAALAGERVELVLDADQAASWPADLPRLAQVLVPKGASLAVRWRAARGRFVACAGPADRLHPRMPAVLEALAAESPDTRLFYTDEDRIDETGTRYAPWFKPAWDPLLWREQDYLGRSAVLLRATVTDDQLDAIDADAPWFSLLMQAVQAAPDQPRHIPHVLRHVSGAPGPVCAPMAPAGTDPGARASVWNRHLARTGSADRVVAIDGGRQRFDAAIEHWPSVDIIIPTRDRVDLLALCVGSLLGNTRYDDYRVTIVDNGSIEASTHAYFEHIGSDSRVRVLRYDQPFNYSAINNYAVARCDGDIVVLLNNDIEIVDSCWLETMVRLAAQPETGAVGAKLFYPDGSLQHAGVALGVGGVAAHAFSHHPRSAPGDHGRAMVAQRYSAVTAACLAVRRRAFVDVGGLDESIAVAFNDVDFCLRLRAHGLANAWTPHAVACHHESASRGTEDDPVKQARFTAEVASMLSRWADTLVDDPAYSPNLTLAGPAFELDARRHAVGLVRAAMPIHPAMDGPAVVSGAFEGT